MLLELNIKNFAIIEDLRVEFTKGLNLLTGETGSGKSIIIEALGIILGGRGTKDLIKTGKEKAILQATFSFENIENIKNTLSEYGITVDKDNLVIITREISLKSPSISRVNGQTITLTVLNKISSKLVDIFAQEEHQSLLNIQNHRILIDSFGDDEFKETKRDIESLYNEYKLEEKVLKDMSLNSQERERKIDLYKFQIDEIDEARLTVEDDIELENTYNKLKNTHEIKQGIGGILESFDALDFDDISILNLLSKNISILSSLIVFDNDLNVYLERLKEVNYELEDINREFIHYMDNMEIDEDKLVYVEDRLNLINKLKNKYGNSIKDILDFRNNAEDSLDKILNYEDSIKAQIEKIQKIKDSLMKSSKKLSNLRKNISVKLEKEIAAELNQLNMDNIEFKVVFEENPVFTNNGIDLIEFMISTNIGEGLKPLSRIVSGGEMSRIMLAFKSILAEYDNIPTLVFDEIDTGISGRTAQIVGEKIKRISKHHQVISISHLPQIVALADNHYLISKDIKDERVITNITKLSKEERVEELARLLGGVEITNTTLSLAKEMLNT